MSATKINPRQMENLPFYRARAHAPSSEVIVEVNEFSIATEAVNPPFGDFRRVGMTLPIMEIFPKLARTGVSEITAS